MCYSGYKGTIKRAKKQMKFDFSEREYLRGVFPKVRLSERKAKVFGFSKREYLRRKFKGTISPKSLISA